MKANMKRGVVGALVSICVGIALGAEKWTVVAPENPSDNVKFAAWDLGNHLQKMTGAADAGAAAEVRFEVGTDAAKAKCLAAAGTLARGDSVAVGEGRTVYVWGEGPVGTPNGVYCLLENRYGCRWLTAWGDDVVPKRDSLVLGKFADVNRPVMKRRWLVGPTWMGVKVRNGMLCYMRNRLNASVYRTWENVDLPKGVGTIRPEYSLGGYLIHASTRVMPLTDGANGKSAFKEHPDWYSMDKKGRRVATMQLCYSNPELREELTRRYLKLAAGDPEGIFDLTQSDDWGDEFCNCAGCKALVEKYGTPGAPLFDYARELCSRLAEKYPKAGVRFLAYRKTQTEFPPNAAFGSFPANAYPTLAPINDDFTKPLDHPNNIETLENFRKWTAVSDNQLTWSYPMPYGANKRPPFAAIRRWTRDMRLLADAGVNGYGFEHDVGYGLGITFADLQCWLMMKAFENPRADIPALIRDFCRHYYGAGAEDVLRFLTALEICTQDCTTFKKWADYLPEALTAENLAKWDAMLGAAEAKVAGDPGLVQHVREAREGVDLYLLKRWTELKAIGYGGNADAIYDRITNTAARAMARRNPNPPDETSTAFKEYKKLVASAHVDHIKASKGVQLPPEFAGIPAADIIEIAAEGDTAMPDSPIGSAACDPADCTKVEGFECGGYDHIKGEFMALRTIKWSEAVPDRFHFYKIGSIRLPAKSFIWFGWRWRNRVALDDYCRPGENDLWNLWMSYKFEGPWVPGSKAKENRAWLDRVLLIRKRK